MKKIQSIFLALCIFASTSVSCMRVKDNGNPNPGFCILHILDEISKIIGSSSSLGKAITNQEIASRMLLRKLKMNQLKK